MISDPDRFDAISDTPLGPVGIRMTGDSVAGLGFPPPGTPPRAAADADTAAVMRQVSAYFSDPRLQPKVPMTTAGTDFQRRVWQALCRIPAGQVRTYGELAKELGTAARAVGGACRANPCPILVPCHRVVAAHGRGGYAGATSGRWMAIKEQLLRHEGVAWPE